MGDPEGQEQRSGSGRSMGSLLSRHPVPAVAFLLAAGLRLLVVASYGPILLLQSDGYVYLRKAVELEPAAFRPVGYSFFLRPFVEISSMRAVAIAQHLIGLAIALAIYLLIRSWGGGQVSSTLASAPILFDAYQLDIEHYVLAETLFQALCFAGIYLLIRPRPARPWAVAAAGVLVALSALVRLVGVLVIAPLVLYLIVRHERRRDALILLIAFAVPVSLYALWFQSHHGDYALTNKSGWFLYGRVATWVDCADLDVEGYQEVLCDPRPVDQRPPANHYVFSGDSPAQQVDPPPGVDIDEVLADYSRSVILQQPAGYLARVGKDVLHAFAPGRYSGRHDAELELWTFPETFRGAGPHAFLVEKYEGSPPPDIDEERFRIRQAGAAVLRGYQRYIYTWGPALAVMVIIAMAGMLGGAGPTRGLAALLGSIGLILMVFPFMTVQFDYRFILLALPYLPTSAALAVIALRERQGRLRREVSTDER